MPIDENALTSPQLKLPPSSTRPRRFFSLRWRILLPIVAVLMAALMCAAYGIAYALVAGDTSVNQDDLVEASRSIARNAIELGRVHRTEVDRIGFTRGVPEGILAKDGVALQPLVEPLAALAGLDLVILGDAEMTEVIGLQRVAVSGSVDYAVTTGTELTGIRAVQSIMEGADSASVIVSVERRPMLMTAGPVLQQGQVIGVVVVGTDTSRVLNQIKGGNNVDLALFGGSANYLGTTLPEVVNLEISDALYNDVLSNPEGFTQERLEIEARRYRAAYFPFVIGQTPLGVLAVYQKDESSFASEFGRQLLSLAFALVAAVVCIAGYVAVGRSLGRVERLRQTVNRLAAGEEIRAHLKPHDEIGELAVAVDRYAAAAQLQVRQLQNDLRQQRRQIAHLNAILDSLAEGVVVQDIEGRVMTMNAAARELLGVFGDSDSASSVRAWSAQVQEKLGAALAPGIYALDESALIQVGGKILQVEAAAIQSVADKRIGTVITLRDVTADVERDAKRDALIESMANDVHLSITQRAQAAALEVSTKPQSQSSQALANFAREIAQDARAMQRLITDYRDLTLLKPNELRQRQHPVNVVDLLLDLAEEWRPAAQAAGLGLDVDLPESYDLHILGDEKRLLLALGNVLDNAIKYSGGAGRVLVSAQAHLEHSRLLLTIHDQGVGIAPEDLPHVFTRFYRGKPTLPNGDPLTVAGTGQGLYLAQKVIEAHGGTISLASLVGQGTQVTILLPLTADVLLEIPAREPSRESVWDQPTRGADSIQNLISRP